MRRTMTDATIDTITRFDALTGEWASDAASYRTDAARRTDDGHVVMAATCLALAEISTRHAEQLAVIAESLRDCLSSRCQ